MSQVSEAELRAMIRNAIARHAGERPQLDEPDPAVAFARAHASHLRLPLSRGDDADGACLIEPSVRCNHCGYCLSYGH